MGDGKDEVEEGVINAYLDNEAAEAITKDEHVGFLKTRLRDVRKEYKILRLYQIEAEASKDEQRLAQLTKGFRENYKARKYCVQQLRALGEQVEDPFIAG